MEFYLGLDMGWQTATYLSAESTMRKRELVIWLMEVVVKYILHMVMPKGHSLNVMVAIRKGIPTRKHSSATARWRMYVLVTVCILENL